MLLGFSKWLLEMPATEEMTVLIGMIEFDFLKVPDISSDVEAMIGIAIQKINSQSGIKFLIYSETNAGFRVLQRASENHAEKVPYLPAITNSSRKNQKHKPLSKNAKATTFGFLGATRKEKGLDELVNRLSGTDPVPGSIWKIQVDMRLLKKIDENTAKIYFNWSTIVVILSLSRMSSVTSNMRIYCPA